MPAVPAPRDPAAGSPGGIDPYQVILVCLGNICRSPMAEVLLRDELDRVGLTGRVTVESAGTGDWHIGGPMDPRAKAELARRGYDGSAHIARQIDSSWLGRYDLFLVMDRKNLATLTEMADGGAGADRIRLMRSYDPAAGDSEAEVPDPFHGGAEDYRDTFELVKVAAQGVATELSRVLN